MEGGSCAIMEGGGAATCERQPSFLKWTAVTSTSAVRGSITPPSRTKHTGGQERPLGLLRQGGVAQQRSPAALRPLSSRFPSVCQARHLRVSASCSTAGAAPFPCCYTRTYARSLLPSWTLTLSDRRRGVTERRNSLKSFFLSCFIFQTQRSEFPPPGPAAPSRPQPYPPTLIVSDNTLGWHPLH